MPLTDQHARDNAVLIGRYAGTPGPWTPQTAQTLIVLGAQHSIGHDRGESFAEWGWDYAAPGFTLDVHAYEEPNDNAWLYTLQLAGPPVPDEESDQPLRRHAWVVPAIYLYDLAQVYDLAAGLINAGLAGAATHPTTTPAGRA